MMAGLPWEILRPNAMELKAPFDHILIDLNSND